MKLDKKVYDLCVLIIKETNKMSLGNKREKDVTINEEDIHNKISNISAQEGYTLNELLEIISTYVEELSEEEMINDPDASLMLQVYQILQYYA